MKQRQLFIRILAVLFAIPLAGTVAQGATIRVIETFDYPGSLLTRPQKINDYGAIAGIFIDPTTGASEGFLFRSRVGQFSEPIIEPNTDTDFTELRGINNRRTSCGDYTTSDGVTHGFFHSSGVFTDYDISSVFTVLLGINNSGDFCGSFIDDADGIQKGFVSIGGTVTPVSVPDAATLTYQINDSDQATGYYIANSDGLTHGYLRDSSGNLTFPIDPAGSTGTILFGNNDSNWVVGRYTDASGITHGLFFITPGDFVTFDFPGAAGFTSLNGINREGFICGRYMDASGNEHGFVAKVNPNATDEPQRNNPSVAPVKSAQPSPEALRSGVPAS